MQSAVLDLGNRQNHQKELTTTADPHNLKGLHRALGVRQ